MENKEIRTHIFEIFAQELLMSLATSGVDGPWASIVEYAADDDLNVYWLSDPASRHSQNIAETTQAACTITLPLSERGQGIGLQIGGIASQVNGAEVEFARKLIETKRSKEISATLLAERTFYKLTPTMVYLLHEPLLGYTRVAYEMKKEGAL